MLFASAKRFVKLNKQFINSLNCDAEIFKVTFSDELFLTIASIEIIKVSIISMDKEPFCAASK